VCCLLEGYPIFSTTTCVSLKSNCNLWYQKCKSNKNKGPLPFSVGAIAGS
jgi:hypothetical protein